MTKQRETFDQVAALYDEVRPPVPDEVVETLWERLRLRTGASVLEIGCGTGQLTRPLLARGARVLALEPGASLAAICREKAAAGDLRVVESTFEDWRPTGARFDAVVAVQAAHWIEPAVFLDRAVDVLEAAGRIGLVWHVDTSAETAFWKATQPLYDRYLPDAPTKPPQTLPRLVADYEEALRADARYAERPRETWPWTRAFDEATYRKLLLTHSPVRLLAEPDRQAFLDGHAEVFDRFGGRVDRHYETVLLGAERRA